jgi:hypothetical protein
MLKFQQTRRYLEKYSGGMESILPSVLSFGPLGNTPFDLPTLLTHFLVFKYAIFWSLKYARF